MIDRPFDLVGLVVLDGFGLAAKGPANAIEMARMPNWRLLCHTYPTTQLGASGAFVGLPDGEMGNSEVGHLTMGAGYAVAQTRVRIDRALADGTWTGLTPVREMVACAKAGKLHVMGLLGPGGVHAVSSHGHALLDFLAHEGAKDVAVHLFLDGRDTPPRSAGPFLDAFLAHLPQSLGFVATVAGRYYAMDRDRRWARTEAAYRAIACGEGEHASSAGEALAHAYARGEDDEFVRPTVIERPRPLAAGDTAFFWNFRADRARQLSSALSMRPFDGFAKVGEPVRLITMTEYDSALPAPALFPSVPVAEPVGAVVAAHGLGQLRAAETEKYAHVTYFFNGGREEAYPEERRRLVPSPPVTTYDLAPQMSAAAITDAVLEEIRTRPPALVVMNYANADMVGHTGVLPAAIEAAECLDREVGRLWSAFEALGGALLVTADHGNAERMVNETTGAPHTAHTTAPVPAVILADRLRGRSLRSGLGLASVGVTLLDLLALEKAPLMDAPSLLDFR